MNKISLIALIGIPGSGKTTFCNNIKKSQCFQHLNIIHVCYDELFDASESITHLNFKENRKKILVQIESLIESILKSGEITDYFKNISINKITSKFLILIDDNNYYLGMRYELFKIARKFQISYGQIFFEVQLNIALYRNSLRSKKVANDVIEKMALKLEIPVPDKNKFEKNTYKNSNEINWNSFLTFLENSFEDPEKSKLDSMHSFHHSNSHAIDILLRKEIKKKIDSVDKSRCNVSLLANNLNEKRKSILNDIKLGIINFQNESDYIELLINNYCN